MKGSFGLFGMTPSSRNMVVCGVRGATLASSDVWDGRPAPVIVSKVFFRVSNRYIALLSAILRVQPS
jgi:hypothetical protein